MRILILSHFYTPEPNDIRIHQLAKGMAARGHTVTALTTFPNYPAGRIYDGYRQRPWMREERDGVRVFRMPLYPDHSRSALKRAANYFSFAASATILGPLLSGPIDVMWVYQPPVTTGIPARWISLLRRTPFIYEIHDIWPETIVSSGMVPPGPAFRMLGALSNSIYRSANVLIVTSPGMKQNLMARGIPDQRINIIPQWADEDIYKPVPRDMELGREFGLAGKFNVMFAGNIGMAQALDVVLDAAQKLVDLPDVQFVLIGGGLEVPHLKEEAARRRLGNVRFIDPQPAAAISSFSAWAEALLIHLRDDPLFAITIPAKTQSYLACGRPVICALSGDGAQVIKEANAGLVCPPENPGALAQAVRDLHSMPAEQRDAMGAAGRETFLQKFRKEVLLDTYEDLFRSVARRR